MPRFPLRAGKPFDVVGFGFNTHDHVCVVPRQPAYDGKQRLVDYFQQPGGQVPTALVALQRWGVRTAYVGPFGDDEGGRLQRASLVEEGVDLTAARLRPRVASQTSIILVDQATGDRTVLWHRPDGLAWRVEELERRALVAGRVLLMDADDIETAIIAARWAKEEGVLVVLDVDLPGPRTAELLRSSDVVIVSDGFPQHLTGTTELGDALAEMARMGPRVVAATRGGGGAVGYADGAWHEISAFRVEVVDTTSAGDLFHAGCIYGLLQAWPLPDVWRFAAAAAALECTKLGGRIAIPTLGQVIGLTV